MLFEQCFLSLMHLQKSFPYKPQNIQTKVMNTHSVFLSPKEDFALTCIQTERETCFVYFVFTGDLNNNTQVALSKTAPSVM